MPFFAGNFFYSLPPLCLLSVANLALFRAELVTFKPVIYMLFLFILCSVLAACSFFSSSEPQGEGRNPSILSEASLLMLAAQGQEGHTSPYALDCSTSLAGSTSTSDCNLSPAPRTIEGQTSVSLTARSLKARKQPWLLQINTNRASVPFFLTGRQKESHPWGCFQQKRKSILFTY